MPGESIPSLFLKWVRIFTIGRRPKWTLVRIGVLVVLTVVVSKFVLLPIKVDGISMEPTYHNGSINFVNRLAYLSHEPQRGDVVAIRLAGEHRMLMKRIVGLPGESISFSNGFVCVNGEPQDEPYLKFRSRWELPPQQLSKDEYYFVGDNRSMIPEDHTHGSKERRYIVGKILLSGSK